MSCAQLPPGLKIFRPEKGEKHKEKKVSHARVKLNSVTY